MKIVYINYLYTINIMYYMLRKLNEKKKETIFLKPDKVANKGCQCGVFSLV